MMKHYRVYLWKSARSTEADAFKAVQAVDAQAALLRAMQLAGYSYVSYAWVVPDDETLACVDCYRVLRVGATLKRG